MKEMVGGCCVCSDESGSLENPLVYCDGDGCNVAVHQACYGIITVPQGPWFCKRCESQERAARVVSVSIFRPGTDADRKFTHSFLPSNSHHTPMEMSLPGNMLHSLSTLWEHFTLSGNILHSLGIFCTPWERCSVVNCVHRNMEPSSGQTLEAGHM